MSGEKSMTAGDLTDEHVGLVVLDVPGIAGWERHLLLSYISRRDNGLWLHFRWNDDPAPSNTKRGQYACGQRVDPNTPVRVQPAPTSVPSEVAETTAGEREVEALATWLHDEVGGCCVSRFPECVFGGDAIRDEARRLLTTGYLAALLDRVRREEGAKVLREAADEWPGTQVARRPIGTWLRDRADRIDHA